MTEPLDSSPNLNPYVGPRAFLPGEPLFGRDREARELLALWLAERIVLLHSPSGAGKTSLIQALLLAALKSEEIEPLPVIRVSAEAPPKDCPEVRSANRYVLGALLSMDGARPAERQIPLPELAALSLDAYLTRRAGEERFKGKPMALVFDQFEEILHLDPTDVGAKEEFFDQVGLALRNRDRWALFSMREDYVGALEPYLRRLPTRLRTTFRLDLLGEAAARLAIVEPARRRGVAFDAEAATALVDDLRTVWVQRPDGSRDQQLGPHIEPVQLQVVCHRLWSRLPPGAKEIRPEKSTEAAGDVDAALAGYYADSVSAIAGKTGVRERAIREWIETQLITEQRTRGQVLFAPEKSQGLENTAIKELVDAHLVREDRRRGFTWYELAHDRLIAPVLVDNARWMQESLHPLQRQAGLWARQGRSAGLLMAGPGLRDAEAWAGAHEAEILPVENDFLVASRAARDQWGKELESRRNAAELARQQRENRRFRSMLAVISMLAVVAGTGFYFSQEARKDLKNKASELQKANDELSVKNQQLVEVYDSQTVPQHERAKADEARQLIASGRTVKERREILVQYITKKHNPDIANKFIEQGFRVRNLDSKWDATNAIWYGPGVQAEDVRVVALTLTEAGVKVTQIESYQDPASHQNIITIGTSTGSLTMPAMTVDQIKTVELTPYTPPPTPKAPTPATAN
ncbi:MAG TPA: hypothetical protein VH988_24480 [Thermoanaerobaculia bacterium]|jgi:hypothetical protein|nr:hypothetical protein [Thermoanaerobaculia bacterium]